MFARALGTAGEAPPSPAFSLIQEYKGNGHRIAHVGWYRLEHVKEIEAFGVREYLQPPWICLIEWLERTASLPAQDTTGFDFSAWMTIRRREIDRSRLSPDANNEADGHPYENDKRRAQNYIRPFWGYFATASEKLILDKKT